MCVPTLSISFFYEGQKRVNSIEQLDRGNYRWDVVFLLLLRGRDSLRVLKNNVGWRIKGVLRKKSDAISACTIY